MTTASESERARARLGHTVRYRGPDSPETAEARRELQTAKLADKARELVADWPALDDGQRHRVASILRSVLDNGDAA
jgi:hypothetical protein